MFARLGATDDSWAADELDAEARDNAAAAAAQLGLDLSEYLSQLMLALALEEHGALAAPESSVGPLLPTHAQEGAETSPWQELQQAFGARCAGLEQRMDRADAAAQRASEADASLRQTLAQQHESFSREVENRIETALAELRAAADLAAGRADAATAALAEDLRSWRAAVDTELSETNGAAQLALAEMDARIDDLATTVVDTDLALRGAIRDLGSKVAGTALGNEVAADQAEMLRQRLQETDSKVVALAAANEAALTGLGSRIADVAHAVSVSAERTDDSLRTVAAETERVEACTLVSLAKLASDIADIRLQQQAAPLAPAEWEQRFDQRLSRLEAAAEAVVSTHAVEALRLQLADLRDHLATWEGADVLSRRVDDLFGRLAASETANAEAFTRLHDAFGVLESNRQAAATTGERLRAVEIAVSGLADRIEQRTDESGPHSALAAVATRMAEIEAAQAMALDAIHAQLALFIDAVNGRMEALEASNPASSLGQVASAFDAFRELIEDRIGYIESHSVRALQHVAETVSVLEERFGSGGTQSASA